MERQVKRFLVSQAIPMVLMGMPGIYIHSLLGSRNDLEGVKNTGRARSINRAQLDADEMRRELADADSLRARVFSGYSHLLRIRSNESGFHPDARQEILDFGPGVFAVKRHNLSTGRRILALHNVTGNGIEISLPESGRDILSDMKLQERKIMLEAYQICWISLDS
jgi:sucrose phosphorylase